MPDPQNTDPVTPNSPLDGAAIAAQAAEVVKGLDLGGEKASPEEGFLGTVAVESAIDAPVATESDVKGNEDFSDAPMTTVKGNDDYTESNGEGANEGTDSGTSDSSSSSYPETTATPETTIPTTTGMSYETTRPTSTTPTPPPITTPPSTTQQFMPKGPEPNEPGWPPTPN